VKPDLTVFGKVIGGGYAGAGGVGGPTDLIEYMAAGVGGGKKRAYVGGTMAANPLTALAGYETIREIERTNAIQKADKAGDRLTKGLVDIIERYDLPYVAYNQGSISHLESVGTMFLEIKIGLSIFKTLKEINLRKHAMEEMGAAYMAEGIVTLAGSRMYTSMATTDQVVDDALTGFENVFKKVDLS
jgi:glutamate-1-semialdehyde 2,1-aminomutase